MQKVSEQLDIFGNWKSLEKIELEKKCDKRYINKSLRFKKKFIKNGGVLNVNKTFIKSN